MQRRPLAFAPALLVLASPAFAAQDAAQAPVQTETPEKKDETLKKAGEIATQPARDVGIAKTKIPAILVDAQQQPYAPPSKSGCAGIGTDIAALNEVLGPDFTSDAKANEDKFGKLAAAGGEAVVNSLIPFRGLVREVSGAAPAERRLDAAVNAGLARRGFLHGLATARKCKLP